MHQPIEHARPPGLTCDECGQSVASRGDYFSVHFPSVAAVRPCPRSWPRQPAKGKR